MSTREDLKQWLEGFEPTDISVRIALVNGIGQYAVLEKHDGRKELAGGGVEIGKDEQIIAAADREINEETGLERVQLALVKADLSILGSVRKATLGFLGWISGMPKITLSEEHVSGGWLTPRSAIEQISFDFDKQVVRNIVENNLLKKYAETRNFKKERKVKGKPNKTNFEVDKMQ